MKIKIIKVIIWTLVIIWMSGIFYLSHQSSQASGKVSEAVAETVYKNVDLTPERFEYKKDSWLIAHYEQLMRKLAHLFLYVVLGGLLAMAISLYTKKKNRIFLFSGIIGIIYAVSDETHQYFIPGRSFLIKDILIDSVGVIIGSVLFILLLLVIYKLKKVRNK
ncbi:MAG: VanZ family protein [Ruminococcaceae bacterium]|nr:VanZ family protein [Oscillospiraceae bacterium]